MAPLNYDPKLPVYAQPETQAPNATVDYGNLQQQTATAVDPNKGTVAGQMRGLLAAFCSPLFAGLGFIPIP